MIPMVSPSERVSTAGGNRSNNRVGVDPGTSSMVLLNQFQSLVDVEEYGTQMGKGENAANGRKKR